MRSRSPFAFVGVIVVVALTLIGFAAFSATPLESAQTADGVALSPTASGRVAATALGSKLTKPPATPTETSDPAAAAAAPDLQALTAETLTTITTTTVADTSADTFTTSTTAPPTDDDLTAPPTTTTAPPVTTTTAPPTTTTAPPVTTTTAPPTTTSTAPPRPPPPGSVEHWRPLVKKWFPAEWVDDALVVMHCESRGDPNAYNASSAASGLFQFIPSTWATARASAGWYDADVFDAEANIAVAAWLTSVSSPTWSHWTCKP